MKAPDSNNFDEYLSSFKENFILENRIPEPVFRKRQNNKFVIGQSGDFHRVDVFEQLGDQYGDRELKYLMIEPEANNLFQTENKLLAYSIAFGQDFQKNWNEDLRGFCQKPDCNNKIWPWMFASLQCYVGTSQNWSSYHDNHNFEIDIFCVPKDCDIVRLFGKASWSFQDYLEFSSKSNLRFTEVELRSLQKNYFD